MIQQKIGQNVENLSRRFLGYVLSAGVQFQFTFGNPHENTL